MESLDFFDRLNLIGTIMAAIMLCAVAYVMKHKPVVKKRKHRNKATAKQQQF